MKNLTLAVDERLIEDGRKYAREHHTSLNALLRELLERVVRAQPPGARASPPAL